jgi:hypothetical protein
MAASTTCPECGVRVSAYAAGCAACGADLEAHARAQRVARIERSGERRLLAPLRWPDVPFTLPEGLFAAVTLFAAIWISVLGAILAVFGLLHGRFEGKRVLMALHAALLVLAVVLELTRLV